MRQATNRETIIGRVYQHELVVKQVKNEKSANFGKDFISGKLEVAVDEEGLNVISTHYTYVAPTTKAGGENRTFTALKKIIDSGKTWVADGKDAATMIQLSPSLDLNDFYTKGDGDEDVLVSVKKNEGGFAEIVSVLPESINDRTRFEVDMLITQVTEVEANEEKQIPAHVVLRGAIFDFRGAIKPLDFVVKNEQGMKWFLDQDISPQEPMFTKVWGNIDCTVRIEQITEESAFGEAAVREVRRGRKEWVVTGTAKVPYDFGDEGVLTAEEVQTKMQERQVWLADQKKQREEWLAQQNQGSTGSAFGAGPAPSAAVTAGGFTF